MPVNFGLLQQTNIPAQMAMQGFEQAKKRRLGEANAARVSDLQERQMTVKEGQFGLNQNAALAQQQALEKTQAQARQMKSDVIEFIDAENKATQDYIDFGLKYPQLADQLTAGYKLLDAAGKQQDFQQNAQLMSAIHSEDYDLAKKLLGLDLQAAENSGDERAIAGYTSLLKQLELSPKSLGDTISIKLAAVDKDKFSDVMATLGDVAKRPFDAKQAAADLGKTKAETNKIMSETRKLGQDSKKLVLEIAALENADGLITDPKERIKIEQDLRKEYTKEISSFTGMQDAFRKIQAAENTAAGDISMIISYMKMLDPGSVVREGEFATAQNAAGVPDKLRNTFNRMMSGERLSVAQRKEFFSQSKALMTASRKREVEIRDGLMPTVKKYGLDPENVFLTAGFKQGETKQTNEIPTVTDDASFNALPSGTRFRDPNGVLRTKP